MTTYMISFRIAEVGDPDDRRETLEANMLYDSANHWKDTTSFLIVETAQTIGVLAAWAKEAIDVLRDVVLIRELGKLDARVVGHVTDEDLFVLMPYCKRA